MPRSRSKSRSQKWAEGQKRALQRRAQVLHEVGEDDARIKNLLRQARRSLEEAMAVARSSRKRGSLRSSKVERDLNHALHSLENVGSLRSLVSMDPDLLPESERSRIFREMLAEERREAEAAEQEAEAEESEGSD